MTPELDAVVNRTVSPEELRAAVGEPIPADQRAEILALHQWFTTRYATAEARLAYVRQAYLRWKPRR